jgi:ATP-dependent 26S proteasome regulatory subunit
MSGLPGCGKTRLVRVVASTCQATFLCILELFTKARQAAPTILLIDEIDALVTGRDIDGAQPLP